jgi:hypothetical protein
LKSDTKYTCRYLNIHVPQCWDGRACVLPYLGVVFDSKASYNPCNNWSGSSLFVSWGPDAGFWIAATTTLPLQFISTIVLLVWMIDEIKEDFKVYSFNIMTI